MRKLIVSNMMSLDGYYEGLGKKCHGPVRLSLGGIPVSHRSQITKVFFDMTMSLDGFIAGINISVKQPLGEGGDQLEWFGDDVNRLSDRPNRDIADINTKVLDEASRATGAVIMGNPLWG